MAIWGNLGSRGNVEDRRAFGPTGMVGGGVGILGLALYLIFSFVGGGSPDVGTVLNELQNMQVQPQNFNASAFEGADNYEVFASTVLGSNNDMWEQVFSTSGHTYEEPKLVLFRGATQSSCGGASAEVGPHYCPPDETIYLDETFFDELRNRFGAEGDVAEAYVIAHEVGHHVQNLLGTDDAVQEAAAQGEADANELSQRLELQADCFAGLWAYSIKDRGVFEPGEIQEAIDAASAVGDDRIQKASTGRINPETWTHGSSEQRVAWFNRGFQSGSAERCNTF